MKGFPAPPGAPSPPAQARTAEPPRGARPRAPSTHYPLHSSPYPLPLTEAHCIVTTHFSLPSPPYSLLFHPSLESDLPSKVGELLEERVGVLCLGELM